MPNDVLPDICPPMDATELLDWSQHGPGLARRPFVGTVRDAYGFTVRIEGVQHESGACARRVSVAVDALCTTLEPEAVRQLASALSAAVDEIEALR